MYCAENEGAAQGRLTTSCLSTTETNASGTSKYALSSLRRRQRGQGAAGMRPHDTAKHHAQAQHSQAQPQAQRPGSLPARSSPGHSAEPLARLRLPQRGNQLQPLLLAGRGLQLGCICWAMASCRKGTGGQRARERSRRRRRRRWVLLQHRGARQAVIVH